MRRYTQDPKHNNNLRCLCFVKYTNRCFLELIICPKFQVTALEKVVEKLTQEMEAMKIQLADERNARQRLEAKISSVK